MLLLVARRPAKRLRTVSGSPYNVVRGLVLYGFLWWKNSAMYEFAGAASTGGHVRYAAAFLMAEFCCSLYWRRLLQSQRYCITWVFWLGVHFEAKRLNLKGIPFSELALNGKLCWWKRVICLFLIVIGLLYKWIYADAQLSATVLAILSCLKEQPELFQTLPAVWSTVLGVLIGCATAGIIIEL